MVRSPYTRKWKAVGTWDTPLSLTDDCPTKTSARRICGIIASRTTWCDARVRLAQPNPGSSPHPVSSLAGAAIIRAAEHPMVDVLSHNRG